jgi:hypothetical protein
VKVLDMLIRFLCLTGLAFVLAALGIGLSLVIMLVTYYTLISI